MLPIHNAGRVVLRQNERSPSKILIVDDLPSIVRLLSTALSDAGYHVRNATSGAVAIMTIATEPPDLILLDVRMPGLDGFSVCRYLNSDSIAADIPIIFISAVGDVPDKLEAFSIGAADYITKPFQIAEVLVRIEHQLELRSLRQTLETQNQKLRIILQQYEISETQIHRNNQELEQRVLERTKDLYNTNQALQQEICERQQAQAKLLHLAMYDSLTGLPNRTLLINRLEEMAKTMPFKPSTLLMLDCDRFKAINDTLGHLQGERLLIEISNRITTIIPKSGSAVRLADEKFAILLPLVNKRDIVSWVYLLQRQLAEPIDLGQHEVTVSANVGIVLVDSSYMQAEHVLRDGALALIQAKQTPQGWQIFQPEMHRQALHRLTLEGKLRRALRQQQLRVFYQPIVALTTASITAPIVGYEALIRWQPEGASDYMSPADFIPLAEESDLIAELGNWTFLKVCEQLSQWHRTHPTRPVPFVSVNCSVRHLENEQFSQQIYTILQQTQVEPSWLKVEITENLLIGDTQPLLKTLAQLRHWGIQISIDDFGTGYSSLSYLKQLPVDTLKIDRAFIKDISIDGDNLKIVEAIIRLAQVLNLDVVAEGIETKWQAQQLINLGCAYGQGYWFSPPLESKAAWALLETL